MARYFKILFISSLSDFYIIFTLVHILKCTVYVSIPACTHVHTIHKCTSTGGCARPWIPEASRHPSAGDSGRCPLLSSRFPAPSSCLFCLSPLLCVYSQDTLQKAHLPPPPLPSPTHARPLFLLDNSFNLTSVLPTLLSLPNPPSVLQKDRQVRLPKIQMGS